MLNKDLRYTIEQILLSTSARVSSDKQTILFIYQKVLNNGLVYYNKCVLNYITLLSRHYIIIATN
jgi:hypothetical protein